MTEKPSNPKDLFGSKKFSISAVPMQILGEISVAMQEGAAKYGKHNYRVIGVRASIYIDAAFRHTSAWWEGQDMDPDSNLSHITKAIASLTVLKDAINKGNLEDDRPPIVDSNNWVNDLNKKVELLSEKYPNPKQPFTQKNTAPDSTGN